MRENSVRTLFKSYIFRRISAHMNEGLPVLRAIIIILSLLTSPLGHAQENVPAAPDFNGRWQNDMGSELNFVVHKGEITGSYNTNVGEPEKSKSFPLRGFAQGDQITFSVNFKGYNSLSAWVGQLTLDDTGSLYLRTMWHNTKDIPDAQEKENIWGSIRTGASNFTKLREN
jgi:hypothetical protein